MSLDHAAMGLSTPGTEPSVRHPVITSKPTAPTYTADEVSKASLEYFGGDEIARDVFVTKYALRDSDGVFYEKTPDDMHRRLAREFARIEAKYDNPLSEQEIYGWLSEDGKAFGPIIPQGSPMSGIGNDHQLMSISNCFVIDSPHDSYGGILHTDQEQAQLMKRRGGVGFDISSIRPKGLSTSNAAKTTDGVGVFMERFSNTCREVAQNGRRGALMLSIDVHHPEIETFIRIKNDLSKVTGANISVRVSDEFMEAASKGETYEQRFPCTGPDQGSVIRREVDASKIWNELMECAWGYAEPGILLWDTVKRRSPADAYESEGFGSVSTNPCGEIVLCPNDSCRLLALNVTKFVRDPFTADASFDFVEFRRAARVAQRLMDDLVDLEIEKVDAILAKIDADPEPDHIKHIERNLWEKIRDKAIRGRRTGTGVTGIGDTLAMLGISYASQEGADQVEAIYRELNAGSYESTIDLAEERGSFPIFDWEKEVDHEYLQQVYNNLDEDYQQRWEQFGRRNIGLLTTAPTGSLSIVAGPDITSGIEPAFTVRYNRSRKVNPHDLDQRVDYVDDLGDKWQTYERIHPAYQQWMEVTGKDDFRESPYYQSTAMDIDWGQSVAIQAAAQKWVCHAISKTCNLPADCDVETVKEVYFEAWRSGCKGFTVYRDGCRTGVLQTISDEDETSTTEFPQHDAPERPEDLECEIHHTSVKGEKWTILVGLLDGKPYEVFGGQTEHLPLPNSVSGGRLRKRHRKTVPSKYDLYYTSGRSDEEQVVKDLVGEFQNNNYGLHTRLTSLALRHGAAAQFVTSQLQKDSDSDFTSFGKAVSRVLKKYIPEGEVAKTSKGCPQCGAEGSMIYQEGCMTCSACGYAKCG